jgi:hypothetical protein
VLFRIVALGLIPLVVSALYVRVWPGVASRPVLIGTVGTLIGLTASLVALVWSVWPALTHLGVAGSNRPGPTLGQVTSGRAIWAYLIAIAVSFMGMWLLTRLLGPSRSSP